MTNNLTTPRSFTGGEQKKAGSSSGKWRFPALLFVCVLSISFGKAKTNMQAGFGSVLVGEIRESTIQVPCSGQTLPCNIRIELQRGTDFLVGIPACDESKLVCSIAIRFQPQSGGPKSDSVRVIGTNGILAAVALSGLSLGREAVQIPPDTTPIFSAGGIGKHIPLPSSLVVDGAGDFYFSDTANHTVNRYNANTGRVERYAGTGIAGFNGDGRFALDTAFNSPEGLVFDQSGDYLYVADTGNHVVRRIDTDTHRVETIRSFSAAQTKVLGTPCPRALARNGEGEVFVSDSCRGLILKIDPAGRTSVFAGGGDAVGADGLGEGELASQARLLSPTGVAVAGNDDLYLTDSGHHEVRVVRAVDQRIYRFAGNGSAGNGGDGGDALEAELRFPVSIVLVAGHLLIADSSSQSDFVRAVSISSGHIRTVVEASPGSAFLLATDGDGNVFAWNRTLLAVLKLGFSVHAESALQELKQNHPEELLISDPLGNGDYKFAQAKANVLPSDLHCEPPYLIAKPFPSLLTIRNLGRSPHTIRSISTSVRADLETTCADLLAPGSTCTIVVTPEEISAHASLTITSDLSTMVVPFSDK